MLGRRVVAALVFTIFLLAGCSGPASKTASDPVGPDPSQDASATAEGAAAAGDAEPEAALAEPEPRASDAPFIPSAPVSNTLPPALPATATPAPEATVNLDDLAFTASVTTGHAPLLVDFASQGAEGTAFDWTLDFGVAGVADPVGSGRLTGQAHTYDRTGLYTARFTAEAGGKEVTRTQTVVVGDPSCVGAPTVVHKDSWNNGLQDAANLLCLGADWEEDRFEFQVQLASPEVPGNAQTMHYQIYFTALYGDPASYADNFLSIRYDGTGFEPEWRRWTITGGYYETDQEATETLSVTWDGDTVTIGFPIGQATTDPSRTPQQGEKFQWVRLDVSVDDREPARVPSEGTKDITFGSGGGLAVAAS